MIASQKMGLEIDSLEKEIAELQQKIQNNPVECKRKQTEAINSSKAQFLTQRKKKIEEINTLSKKKLEVINSYLDSLPESTRGDSKVAESTSKLEEHLKELYPETLLDGYICLNRRDIEDTETAEDMLQSIEDKILRLKQNGLAGFIFNQLMSLLDKAADYPQLGLKLSGGMIIVFLVSLIFSPFLLLTILSGLSLVSISQGIKVSHLLQILYSVKVFLNNNYDVDKFIEEKQSITADCEAYLNEACQEAIELVKKEEFHLDPSLIPGIIKSFDEKLKQYQTALEGKQEDLASCSQKLESLISKLEALDLKGKTAAEMARDKYLGKLTWDKQWMETAFIDVNIETHKINTITFAQGNSLYYTDDPEKLKQLSRLLIYQSFIRMHPDFASTVVLDYKYNGGSLTQFGSDWMQRCCKLCYSEEDITTQLDIISNKIRSRTSNILGTSESFEAYNKLMAEYNTTGEYYCIVHIFGLTQINANLLSCIRNGPRVGYFFKFYWTLEEMKSLKNSLPIEYVREYFEITDTPMPRTAGAVRRVSGIED